MPKLKTHRGAAKRFRKTAKGKKMANGTTAKGGIKCRKGFRNHILTKKSTKWKRNQRGQTQIHRSDINSVDRMLTGC